MADVNDGAVGIAFFIHESSADQEARYFLDRFLRGRQTDALEWTSRESSESFKAEREMSGPTVIHHGMNFIEDDRAWRLEHLAARLGGKQEIERLGGGDENMRRSFDERLALGGGSIASPNFCPHIDVAALDFV